jgi:LacI family transcriptional regulator
MPRNSGIVDVGREAGCSINTASRALNNLPGVSAATRARVLEAAAHLHYSPSRVARSLLTHSSRSIGLIVTDCTNPFYASVIRAVEDVANARDFSVILCNSGESHDREVRAVNMLLENRVAGILLTPVQQASNHIQELMDRELPFVLVGRRFRGIDACSVMSDNESGAYHATSLLLKLGHRRIAHVTGRQEISSVAERADGYRRALNEFDLPSGESSIAQGERDIVDGTRCALQVLRRSPRPTAIFAYNDLQALGVFAAARQMGLRIPEDLAVVGFDDIEFAAFAEVPLTTVRQPTYEIGRQAADLLFRCMNEPDLATERQVVLPTELVIRRSSGGPIVQA